MSSVEQRLIDAGCEGTVFIEGDEYDTAILGITEDGRLVYSYEEMCIWLMEKDSLSYEEAAEWIDYNVIRIIPYWGEKAPIIIYDLY